MKMDYKLSFKAYGIREFAFNCFGKADKKFRFYVLNSTRFNLDILSKFSLDGATSINSGLKELEQKNYLIKHRENDRESGKFTNNQYYYIFFKMPFPEEEREELLNEIKSNKDFFCN